MFNKYLTENQTPESEVGKCLVHLNVEEVVFTLGNDLLHSLDNGVFTLLSAINDIASEIDYCDISMITVRECKARVVLKMDVLTASKVSLIKALSNYRFNLRQKHKNEPLGALA